jgi:hypothetical protein
MVGHEIPVTPRHPTQMTNQSELLAALQRDISERLRPVCDGMSEASFQELVRDIALVKLKYGLDGDQSPSLKVALGQLTTNSPDDGTGDSNVT